MAPIAIVELSCAAFLLIFLISLFVSRKKTKSNVFLRISILVCIFTLVIDALAYTIVGTKYPVPLRYTINLLAFEAGTFNSIAFTLYIWSFIKQKAKVNKWFFIAPLIVEAGWFVAILIEFVMGHFITYVDG